MSVQKNFVVKNGLEVKSNLILADAVKNFVGIGTSIINYKLHVLGGIGATNIYVSGGSTISDLYGATLNYTSGTFITANASQANIASGVVTTLSGSTLTYSGIASVGQLNVSGVATLGNLKVSSGIVTATTGIITYYGDGSNLSNIIRGVGISSGGGIVGSGATIIDFRGAAVADVTVSSGIATVNINTNANVSAAGANGQIQYNTSGILNASPNLIFNGNDVNVSGAITASRFISTVTSGTAPFVVLSDTQVTNLNASFLRGKTPPSGTIVGTTDTQTLTNKTLTSPIISSISNTGTITLPTTTTTLVGRNTTDTLTNKTISASNNTITGLTNSNLSGTAAISNANLANSTISGVSLGGNLASLSFGGYITSPGSYNGSAAISISVTGTPLNISDTLVARDLNGDFTAGTITATDFNSTSDITVKENISTIQNGLEIVNQLRGVNFDWKESGNKSIGVIAQEIEKVLPELVKEGEIKSVNYNGLVGVLIEAVKELSSEVEELKKKLV